MLLVRRMPGIINNHRYAAVSCSLVFVTVVYLLFHWRFVCSNIEPWNHVYNLCRQYRAKKVVGDLCFPLCVENQITSLSCHTFHAGKAAVFSAVKNDHSKIVFKRAMQPYDQSNVYWTDNNGGLHYPSETEFKRMIVDHVSNRLNMSIGNDQAKVMARFVNGAHALSGTDERNQEMQELWSLLQDNEYLLGIIYAEKDIFPRVLGSCGQYFAVEYLEPAMEGQATNALSEDKGKASWSARVHLSVLILELLEELDSSVSEGFSLCDIKPSHFGLSPTSSKLKFLDLDVALPKAIANAITADGSNCHVNSDCNLFDCRSKCNMDLHKCDSPITNNNLQVVCEKIFLGWTLTGNIIMPGLLMTSYTPSPLVSLLRQCADRDTDGIDKIYPTPSEDIKERLTATLIEIDKILSVDSYS